jgi:hypothetical protein
MLSLLVNVSPSFTRFTIPHRLLSQALGHHTRRFLSRAARPTELVRRKKPVGNPVWNEDASVEHNEKQNQKARRWAKLELPWCKDKVQLSRRVGKLLQNGQHRLALELTRLASKKPNHAVMSWNLILKFHLTTNKDKPRGNFTLKLFSEV